MQVKITDNALARDLFPMDYHCLGDNENRPVRWMALESLLNNDFSSASDVVSLIFFHLIPTPIGLMNVTHIFTQYHIVLYNTLYVSIYLHESTFIILWHM